MFKRASSKPLSDSRPHSESRTSPRTRSKRLRHGRSSDFRVPKVRPASRRTRIRSSPRWPGPEGISRRAIGPTPNRGRRNDRAAPRGRWSDWRKRIRRTARGRSRCPVDCLRCSWGSLCGRGTGASDRPSPGVEVIFVAAVNSISETHSLIPVQPHCFSYWHDKTSTTRQQ